MHAVKQLIHQTNNAIEESKFSSTRPVDRPVYTCNFICQNDDKINPNSLLQCWYREAASHVRLLHLTFNNNNNHIFI